MTIRHTVSMNNTAEHTHEWEYSDQSEPHKGREYYVCRECGTTLVTDPETGDLLELPA